MIEFIRLSMYPVSGERGKLCFAPLFSYNSEDPARGGTLCSPIGHSTGREVIRDNEKQNHRNWCR